MPAPNDLDALAVSPDGSKLAVASADHSSDFGRDPVIGLYKLGTGQLLRSWTWDGQADIMGRSGGTGSMSFTADGSTIEFPLSVPAISARPARSGCWIPPHPAAACARPGWC